MPPFFQQFSTRAIRFSDRAIYPALVLADFYRAALADAGRWGRIALVLLASSCGLVLLLTDYLVVTNFHLAITADTVDETLFYIFLFNYLIGTKIIAARLALMPAASAS